MGNAVTQAKDWLVKNYWTKFMSGNYIGTNGYTLLHNAAKMGEIDKVPDFVLTKENCLLKDCAGMTVLHYGAEWEGLEKFPKHLLTAETLQACDDFGQTVLHFAAKGGHLNDIPVELLTADNLLVQADDGKNVLHWAAAFGQLDKIPRDVLTEANLLTKPNAEHLARTVDRSGNPVQHTHWNGGTVLEEASDTPMKPYGNSLDQLLGIELSDACSQYVPEGWWERNKEVLNAKKSLNAVPEDSLDVDMF